MKVHELKISTKYFDDVKSKTKRFEIRKDDRGFCVGDIVTLKEWDGEKYTGRAIKLMPIKYILRDCPEYGLQDGFCILGF